MSIKTERVICLNFVEKVLALIKERGITKNKLLADLKLGKNSFVDWSKNGKLPNGATIIKIADYFGVTTDYLLKSGEPQAEPDGALVNVPSELSKILTAATGGSDDITQEEVDEIADYWNKIVKPRRMKQ